MADGDTYVNALVGGAVALVLSFLPFSPLLGGAVAGYLEGGERADGVRVGAVAGLVPLVPFVGFLLFVGGAWGFFLLGGFPARAGALVILVGLLLVVVVGLYTVGLSALGGWLGNYVRYDTDLGDGA